MKKIKIVNNNDLPTIDYKKLRDLQSGFKTINHDELQRLKNSIKRYGVIFPKYVWVDKGVFYIVDGHQTIKALKELEKEGYIIDEIPYIEVKAENEEDAIRKLLILNSKYGKINVFDKEVLKKAVIENIGDILEIPEIRVPEIINIIESEFDKLEYREPNFDKMIIYQCPKCGFEGQLKEYKRVDKQPIVNKEEIDEIEDIDNNISNI